MKQTICLSQLPQLLVLHVKRFIVTGPDDKRVTKRLKTPFTAPVVLDVGKLCDHRTLNPRRVEGAMGLGMMETDMDTMARLVNVLCPTTLPVRATAGGNAGGAGGDGGRDGTGGGGPPGLISGSEEEAKAVQLALLRSHADRKAQVRGKERSLKDGIGVVYGKEDGCTLNDLSSHDTPAGGRWHAGSWKDEHWTIWLCGRRWRFTRKSTTSQALIKLIPFNHTCPRRSCTTGTRATRGRTRVPWTWIRISPKKTAPFASSTRRTSGATRRRSQSVSVATEDRVKHGIVCMYVLEFSGSRQKTGFTQE